MMDKYLCISVMALLLTGTVFSGSFLIPFDNYERTTIIVPEINDEELSIQYLDCAKEYRHYIHNRSRWLFHKRSYVKIRTHEKTGRLNERGVICLGVSDNNLMTNSILSDTPFKLLDREFTVENRQYNNALLFINIDNHYISNGFIFDPDLLTLNNAYMVKKEGKVVERGRIEGNKIVDFEIFKRNVIDIPKVATSDKEDFYILTETALGKKAVKLFKSRKDDPFVATLFESLLLKNPDSSSVKTYLMRLYYRLGEYEEALNLSVNTNWGRITRAMSLIALKETNKAQEELKALLNSNPPENIRNIALFWLTEPYLTSSEYVKKKINTFLSGTLKDQGNAIEDLKLKIAGDPNNSELHSGLGLLYFATRNPYAARSEGKKAFQSANKDKNAIIRGLLVEALGLKLCTEEIVELKGDYQSANNNPNSAMLELYRRKYQEVLKKITDLEPDVEMKREINRVLN